ncbi:MAG: transposase [Fulvivirga sp.]
MGLRNRNLYKGEKCFFVTTTCIHWINFIEYSKSYEILENSLNYVSEKYKASILAYVIMPNHMHAVVYFNEDNRLSDLMRDFKKFTSTMVRKGIDNLQFENLLERLRSNKKGRAFQVWMQRFDDLCLFNKNLVEQKIEYIHCNPLQEKWNLARCPEQYRYSSASFYQQGIQRNCRVTDYRSHF